MNEIRDVEDNLDEYLQAVIGPIVRAGAQIGAKAAQGAAQAGKAAAKGASKAGKAVARGAKAAARKAKSVAKSAGKKVKSKIKDKVDSTLKDKIQAKMKDKKEKDAEEQNQNVAKTAVDRMKNIMTKSTKKSGMASGALGKLKKGVEDAFDIPNLSDHYLREFRMEVRKKLVRELMEAEPAGDDGGSGKKGMDPEVAKEIMKSLEGKTVKAKSGKEIKVSSALNPQYKKTDPKAHKKATDMFKKSAEDFFSKQSRKKQGGKVPKSPEDLKNTPKQTKKPTSKGTPDQKPAKPKARPYVQKKRFSDTSQNLDKANSNMDKAQSLLKQDPDNPKAKQAVQLAANEQFSARAKKATATVAILDGFKAKQDAIKKEHPNPLSKERRQKLAAVKQDKEKAFNKSGMTTKDMINIQNQKDIKDRWDTSIDPAGDGNEELTQVIDGKKVEVGATRINPETGNVEIVSYELDDDGNRVEDEDGNAPEIITTEDEMTSQSDADDKEEKAAERKEYWDEFWKNQFDFSDPIELDKELGLEFGTSSYTNA